MWLIIAEQAGLACVPVLLILAWTGWTRKLRAELPPWRNALCLVALLLLSLNWVGAAFIEVPLSLNPRISPPQGLNEAMLTLSHAFSFLVIGLAFAFRRAPRIQAVLAGLLMLFCWPVGYA
jgi:hypothetical protein